MTKQPLPYDMSGVDGFEPTITSVGIKLTEFGDEKSLTDFIRDIENLLTGYAKIDDDHEGFDESTFFLLRQILNGIDAAWEQAEALGQEADE